MDVEGLNELDDLSDGLEAFVSRRGPNTVRSSIQRATSRLFDRDVLPATKRQARRHVGGYAEDIDDRSLGWSGDNYRHGLGADSVVVDSHEYGTGQYNVNNAGTTGTFDGRTGYRIPAEGTDGPLTIRSGGTVRTVEYVVHPGVEPKKFMERTVERHGKDIAEAVGDELVDSLEDQLGF